ncbi:hypothetical protein NST33_18450 [Paenibacillus sp. FSL L8-0435]|uniref:hypothetical protein n=1 Tax=Paenibacillus sp. FSL L8-0435 TaxID=2954618 RepID=UPI0030D7A525
MKEKLMAIILVTALVMFFGGFMMIGYGMTSDLSYTESMQTLMGYGAIIMLAGVICFVGTIICDNVQTT